MTISNTPDMLYYIQYLLAVILSITQYNTSVRLNSSITTTFYTPNILPADIRFYYQNCSVCTSRKASHSTVLSVRLSPQALEVNPTRRTSVIPVTLASELWGRSGLDITQYSRPAARLASSLTTYRKKRLILEITVDLPFAFINFQLSFVSTAGHFLLSFSSPTYNIFKPTQNSTLLSPPPHPSQYSHTP